MELIFGAIIAPVVFSIFFLSSKKENVITPQKKDLKWLELINNFKSVSPQIRSIEQLQDYLNSIKHQVKNFEADYTFLVAFNSIIRQIRERLRQDC